MDDKVRDGIRELIASKDGEAELVAPYLDNPLSSEPLGNTFVMPTEKKDVVIVSDDPGDVAGTFREHKAAMQGGVWFDGIVKYWDPITAQDRIVKCRAQSMPRPISRWIIRGPDWTPEKEHHTKKRE